MLVLSIVAFFGRFHPLLVHLPIGILLLAILLHWLSRTHRFQGMRTSVSFILLLGAISAVLSAISGWLLATGGEYDAEVLERHRWMGVALATIAVFYYLIFASVLKIRSAAKILLAISVILFLLITITGHLGGVLTHGEGYLTQDWDDSGEPEQIRKMIPDVQEANVYHDIIQPVLQNKCYSCHGQSKQKGKLRLDSRESILKGGEDGKVLIAGKGDESELYKRLTLELLAKKHMPPKGRSQPSEAEINLIHWWINTGAGFDQQVKTLPQDEKIKPLLLALQSDHLETPVRPAVPEEPANPAPADAVTKLQQAGATVVPVSAESHYLSVNFLDSKTMGDEAVKLLEPLAAQVVWLKLGNTAISDSAMRTLSQLPALTRLSLEHTSVTDKGLPPLQKLSKLQYLNLAGTAISTDGLLQLKPLEALRSIYLSNSKVNTGDWALLKQSFPRAVIDTGGYFLPLLEGDTSRVTRTQ